MKEENTSATAKSPKSPRRGLSEAIDAVKKLYAEAKRSSIKREVAAKPLGYASLNGSALTILSTLIQYGLLDQGPGTVAVSQLAMEILHPVNEEQRVAALRKAALLPAVFTEIHKSHHGVSEEVLANQLTQGRYPNDVARQLARIYYENSKLAKLEDASKMDEEEEIKLPENSSDLAKASEIEGLNGAKTKLISNDNPPKFKNPEGDGKVLATYKIPLGANEATLVFTGQQLTTDDFDALADFVEFSKKQFVRALAKKSSPDAKIEEAAGSAATKFLSN